MSPPVRRWLWGAATAAGLAAAAALSVALGLVAGIPLFDGLAPPPLYRWVNPPAPLRGENLPPDGLAQALPLAAGATPAQDVATEDGQVLLALPDAAFAPEPGQAWVSITVRPVDPTRAPRTPPGTVVQGNAYRIDLTYEPSGSPATATAAFGVQLAYPVDATRVAYNGGSGWQLLPTVQEPAAQEVFGRGATASGWYAAVLTGVPPAAPSRVPPWAYAAAGAALLLAAVPALSRRRASPREPPPAPPAAVD
jgi:hypothetical protein